MTYSCFDVGIDNQIANITLNRPDKRNSMNPAFWSELPKIVREIDEGSLARVIVISSTGPHFSSGLDTTAFASAPSSNSSDESMRARQAPSAFYDHARHMQDSFTILETCRIPVLVAIQGGCIGGGVDLVTACDIRYASADAYFTIFETNIGLTADVGTFPRLVKLIPEGYVREMAYTGRAVSAIEAKEMGLVNQVFDSHEALIEGVMSIAAEIASKAPLAVYGCKRMINYARDHTTQDGLDYVAIWNASHFQKEEIQEAMLARSERRPGNFVELPAIRDGKTKG